MAEEQPRRAIDDLSPEERRRIAREYFVHPDPRVFQGALPAVVFVAVNWAGPTQLAIGASFATAVFVFTRNRMRGIIGWLGVLSFAIVSASAVIGLISDSGKAYAAQNVVGDFAIVIVCAGSLLARKPMIGAIAQELVPAIKPVMPIAHPAFMWLTGINGAINLGTGVARWFMLESMSVNAYVVLSRVVFIPLSAAFIVLCYVVVNRVAIAIWPADVPAPVPPRSARAHDAARGDQ